MPPSSDAHTPFARLAGMVGRSNEVALLACLIGVILFFGIASEYFFSFRNMSNVLGQASIMLIAGIGVAMVFMSGEVDISVGSLMAAVAIPLIEVMNATGSLALGIGAALLLGLVIGTVNGLLAAYAGINSLIVTLGTLFIVRGGVYLYTGKQAIPDEVYLESFFQIGNETLLGIIPYSALIAFALVGIFAYVMGWRRFGRQVYAVGSSAAVARLAGFNTQRVKFTCFLLSSLLATISGVLLASRVGSAVHVAGLNFEFQVVAAVVLGGVSLAGGIGTIAGMALGVLILAFVANGLGMLDFPTEWQLVITGAVIVAAVAIDEAKRRRAAAAA